MRKNSLATTLVRFNRDVAREEPQRVRVVDAPEPSGQLHELFLLSAARDPAALALVGLDDLGHPSLQLTYGELAERASRLAGHLRRLGIGSGDRVAMMLPRSVDAIVAEIAILTAGAAFVPIDAGAPADRVAYIVADSSARLILTSATLASGMAAMPVPVVDLGAIAEGLGSGLVPFPADAGAGHPDDLAYIIYTSGSTGRPKGVMVRHRNARHFVAAEGAVLGLRQSDRVFQGFSYAFDMSVEEIWPALAAGAGLVVASEAVARSGPDVAEAVDRCGVTVWHAVPSLVSMIERELPSVRLLNVGGEACPPELVRRWAQPGRRILNTYGPTEATVTATWAELSPLQPITIGKPLPGYEVFIVDEQLNPILDDRAGELCIAGGGVSAGYVNLPEVTADKFRVLGVGAADGAARLVYRTGDLVRRAASGDLVFLGRIDLQVKIRGYRVELGEIENLILESGSVRAAVVALHGRGTVDEALIAYVVPADGAAVDVGDLRSRLAARLPSYMVPASFELLEALPTLLSGKVDRSALPAPKLARSADDANLVPPSTPVEADIAAVCGEVLGRGAVSVEADFFDDLGGHSLRAGQLVTRLRADGRYAHVSMRDIYNCRTIRRLAAHLVDSRPDGTARPEPFHPVSRSRYVACTAAQAGVLALFFGISSLIALSPYLIYLRERAAGVAVAPSVLAGLGAILAISMLGLAIPVLVKRLVVGEFVAGSYPMWGATYFRWWLFRRSLGFAPIGVLIGTPLLSAYWRLLGARVGTGVLISTAAIDAPELVTIGDGATVGGNSVLDTASVSHGQFHIGPVTVGARATVGMACVVGRGVAIGPDAVLEDLSMLPAGTQVGAGERWSGSPARQTPSLPGSDAVPAPASTGMTAAFALASLLLTPLSALPVMLALGGVAALGGASDLRHLLLATPLFALFYVLSVMALVLAAKWSLLGRVVPQSARYWTGFHLRLWIVQSVSAFALTALHPLYGTLYLRPFYRLLGMRFGKGTEMTNASGMVHDLVSVGERSFVADAAVIGAPHFERGTVTIAETTIGNRTFVGNGALVPAGTHIADGALVGVLSRPPSRRADQARVNATWFGSPAMFMPQRQKVTCFASEVTFEPPAALVAQRLVIEAVRILLPIAMLASLSILFVAALSSAIAAGWSAPAVGGFAILAAAAVSTLCFLYAFVLKWAVMGRYRPRMAPLWSRFVWLTELVTTSYELVAMPILDQLRGTPLLAVFLRLLGMRIGRRVYLDTADFTEFDLVSIGDDAAFNQDSGAQTHLFEDRVMKLGRSDIGARTAMGTYSTTLYDTRIGDDASLGDLSIVMKGEELPAGTAWEGSPARPARVAAEAEPGVCSIAA